MSVPLDQPHYGIGPAGMVRFLRKYATFRGRASRSEFWWAQLTLALASVVLLMPGAVVVVLLARDALAAIDADPGLVAAAPGIVVQRALPGLAIMALGGLLLLALAVPTLALGWRRLQDAGLPGGLILAFTLGGAVLSGVLLVTGLAAFVPGFLASSERGARYERSATPALSPDVAPAAWQREAAWSAHPAQRWQAAQPWQQQPSPDAGPNADAQR
ncbi:DUF805 domain-containing protein [Agrococcus jejuensis]|uniref:DUF805 domain-containing protein n=1 Tax=Agrococcus jejuensis TaxID=399736 RepID=UPI0016429D48|nr:DUF805 domain-containing protein [Agrococcus jejuensis]